MGDDVKEADDSSDSICSELDALSMHMLRLMKEYIECKVSLEDLIKSGSLHLAKSRYIMGNRSVSALQLPTEDGCEIAARTTLLSSKTGSGPLESVTLELSRLTVDGAGVSRPADGLKYRPKAENAATDRAAAAATNNVQDPLKWFGVLVPSNLRHAQSCFNKAIELAVQCANVQLEMDATRKKFEKCVARKKIIARQSNADQNNT